MKSKLEDFNSKMSRVSDKSIIESLKELPEYDRLQIVAQIKHYQILEQGEFNIEKLPFHANRVCMLVFKIQKADH